MKSKFILALSASFLILGGCEKDETPPADPVAPTGTLRLVVNPHWNGQPIDDLGTYTDINDFRVDFTLLNIYFGDLILDPVGSQEVVSRIELFKFLSSSETRERSYQLTPGNYSGVQIGVGVPMDLNNANVNSYPANSPLWAQQGTHWGMANYRFVMFDAVADTSATGSGMFNQLVSIHTGRDAYYRTVDANLNVPITKDSTTVLTLDMDVSKFLYSATDTIDLRVENVLHGSLQPPFPAINEEFSDNVQGAVSFSL